jgi:hypothetical protein
MVRPILKLSYLMGVVQLFSNPARHVKGTSQRRQKIGDYSLTIITQLATLFDQALYGTFLKFDRITEGKVAVWLPVSKINGCRDSITIHRMRVYIAAGIGVGARSTSAARASPFAVSLVNGVRVSASIACRAKLPSLDLCGSQSPMRPKACSIQLRT